MSTFSQWRTSFIKKPEPRQITWLCGPEKILIEDIVSTIRNALNPDPWNLVLLFAGTDSERQIWAEVDQHPTDNRDRLVIIRNAEQLKHPERLIEFIKERTKNPHTFLLLVSNDETLPRQEQTEAEKKSYTQPQLMEYLLEFKARGHIIECKPFTAATAKHAVAWVQSKVKMREVVAGHLLDRADGDLRLVRDVCTKLAVLPGEITLATVTGILSEVPRDSFSNALLALDRKTALMALQAMPVSDYSRVIGSLDAQLDLAGRVHDGLVEHKTPAEIARACGKQGFLVPDVIPVAKHYDKKRRLAIRMTLATADEALRGGETKGVMELIVAFW